MIVCSLVAERGREWRSCFARPRCTKALRDVSVSAWLRLRFCCRNSCSPARSPLARKPLLSHIFIGSLSALDYRVRKEVPATCISSCSRCIYRMRNVGFRELAIWSIGCEISCKMFVFANVFAEGGKLEKNLQTNNPENSVQKAFTKLYWCYTQLWATRKKNQTWFIFQVSADFYFLLCTAASTWKQSLLSRKLTWVLWSFRWNYLIPYSYNVLVLESLWGLYYSSDIFIASGTKFTRFFIKSYFLLSDNHSAHTLSEPKCILQGWWLCQNRSLAP